MVRPFVCVLLKRDIQDKSSFSRRHALLRTLPSVLFGSYLSSLYLPSSAYLHGCSCRDAGSLLPTRPLPCATDIRTYTKLRTGPRAPCHCSPPSATHACLTRPLTRPEIRQAQECNDGEEGGLIQRTAPHRNRTSKSHNPLTVSI
jgi:hypothetical protein